MNQLKISFIAFLLSLSFTAKSQIESTARMEQGLAVTEELFEFLTARPCEFGIVKDCDRPLSGQDMNKLKNLFARLQSWKKEAFDVGIQNLNLFSDHVVEVIAGETHGLKESERFNPLTLRMEKVLKIVYHPMDSESVAFAQGIRVSTTMGLLLYDSFFQLAKILSKAKKFRSILEYDMPEEGKALHETYSVIMNKDFWSKLLSGVSYLKQEEKLRGSVPQIQDAQYFEQYLAKSFTASRIKKNDFFFRVQTSLFMSGVITQARFFQTIDRMVGLISQFFGNTVGQIQTRDGKLKALAQDQKLMAQMKKKLKPLDIFFEKTPFRLTDRFIPGYYGHVAIWMGTPEELMEMTVIYQGKVIQLFDHPVVLPYLERMSQGQLVVEALREPGVTMNTLEHFLDVDDFLVLNPIEIEAKGEHILQALKQVGKPYDFNFDVETERAIVCSELAYTVFSEYDWPTSRSLGRYTISPDHVAWKSFDSCFKPSLMYIDGVEILKDQRAELRRLLELPGGISYTPVGTCLKKF